MRTILCYGLLLLPTLSALELPKESVPFSFDDFEKFIYNDSGDGTSSDRRFDRFLEGVPSPTQKERPNLLFIMTDQQRFDTLSIAGNTVLQTPNMDRIANEGVFFKNTYATAPVCGPSRTSLITGLSLENTGVTTNDLPGTPNMKTYDMHLADEGYVAEYYGKWHSPIKLADVYNNNVETETYNLFGPYWNYLMSQGFNVPEDPLREGLVASSMSGQGYTPIRLDSRYEPQNRNITPTCECEQFGIHRIRAKHSLTAFEARRTMKALNRLGGPNRRPFSLHVSFNSPHAPHTPVARYAGLYPKPAMPIPPSINDTMSDSPYFFLRDPKFSNPRTIGHFVRLYYAQVKEVDDWLGRILKKLDEKDLTNNTMLVFTSDHGEMLGSHGMQEKGVMYEESVRVPMLMRFPGRIPAGTVVDESVSHRDVFATILDYMGVPEQPSDGQSLRRFIEGGPINEPHFTVSETGVPLSQYMVRMGEWKLIMPNRANSTLLNVLYNLDNDPFETLNLIGFNDDRAEYLETANELRFRLAFWCLDTSCPDMSEILARVL